jgi:GAF domain-containing protein
MTAPAAVHPGLESAPDITTDPASAYVQQLHGMTSDLFTPRSVVETLHTVVALARQRFGGDGAGVILTAQCGGAASAAASTAHASRADAIQVEHHEGPAFDAVAGQHPALSAELRFDGRWRFWAPQAADLGFRSVLSLPLADNGPIGALTLYSRRPSFFGSEILSRGLAFAQQAAIAVGVAVEREQLLRARDSRGIIGQAQGILMERYDMTSDQAFAVLRRYSSHLNQKLRFVAERIIRNRTLPELNAMGLPSRAGKESATGS